MYQFGKLQGVEDTLKTYARQVGYYGVTPDKDYKPNHTYTRGQNAVKQEYPSIDGAEYLIKHLNNMGWCSSSGMGAIPLSFTEIDAYNRSTYSFLNAEEVMIIRKMSENYVSESNDRNPTKQPPFGTYSMKSNGLVTALRAIGKKAN